MAIVSNETLVEVCGKGNLSSLLPADVELLAELAMIDAPGIKVVERGQLGAAGSAGRWR